MPIKMKTYNCGIEGMQLEGSKNISNAYNPFFIKSITQLTKSCPVDNDTFNLQTSVPN